MTSRPRLLAALLLLVLVLRGPRPTAALAGPPPSAPLPLVLRSLLAPPLRPAPGPDDRPFRLRVAPLIGGPPWLPLHVQVLVMAAPASESESRGTCVAFDLVPRNATAPSTLRALLRLESVAAQIRAIARPALPDPCERSLPEDIAATEEDSLGADSNYLAAARAFCRDYRAGDRLHLVQHNCWSFALALLQELELTRLEAEEEQGGPR